MQNSKHNIENFLMFRKSLYMKLVSLSTFNLIRFFPDSPNQISFLGRVLKRNFTGMLFAPKSFFELDKSLCYYVILYQAKSLRSFECRGGGVQKPSPQKSEIIFSPNFFDY